MRTRLLGSIALLALLAACTAQKKEAWQDSGSSWRGAGNAFRRALGLSVQGEGSAAKEEWKEFGRDTGQAGKDTAEAIGKSVVPPSEEDRPASPTPNPY